LHGLLTNINKNSGKKIKIRTSTLWPPGGRFLGFFHFFFENIRISASVDGGPSRGSRVRRPGSEDLHGLLTNININSGKKMKFGPPSPLLLIFKKKKKKIAYQGARGGQFEF
jgi:hypothetical protein